MIQNSSNTKNVPLFCLPVTNHSCYLWQPQTHSPIPVRFDSSRMSHKWSHIIFSPVGVHWDLWTCKYMSVIQIWKFSSHYFFKYFFYTNLFVFSSETRQKGETVASYRTLCSFSSVFLSLLCRLYNYYWAFFNFTSLSFVLSTLLLNSPSTFDIF